MNYPIYREDKSLDYLNRNGARNEKNTEEDFYNCGGYALKTYSWYRPYENRYDFIEYAELLWDDDYSFEEIIEGILQYTVKQILKDFPKLIECDLNKLTLNQTVIAYRVGMYNPHDWDFHFKIRENGRWTEKCGNFSITDCDLLNEEYWGLDEDDDFYDSRIVYFTYRKEVV